MERHAEGRPGGTQRGTGRRRATVHRHAEESRVVGEGLVPSRKRRVLDRLLERRALVGPVSIEGPKAPLSEAGLIKELYDVNTDGRLVMSQVPKAPVDVLLLVLYGISKVQDSPWVSAPMLVKTARAAGAEFERGDRLLGKRPQLIQEQGRGRGKSYRLTPAGEEHCLSLVRELVG